MAEPRRALFWLLSVAGALLFFRVPDLDISLLGIRYHRYFLFHSAALPLLAWLALRSAARGRWRAVAASVVAAAALGVGVHLVTDVFQSKSIVFPFVGTLVRGTSVDDRLWVAGNAAVCGGFLRRAYLASTAASDTGG